MEGEINRQREKVRDGRQIERERKKEEINK
jgi:hypothetical protein